MAKKRRTKEDEGSGPKLLSGGNPQIPKGEGDGPVQEYIAAMPGWKSAVGRRADEIVTRTVPEVRKAVKWNSPLLIRSRGAGLLNGASLEPIPPGGSRDDHVRY